MRKSELQAVAIGAMFVIMIVALVLVKDELGFDTSIDINFTQIMPPLSGIAIGLILVAYTRGVFGLPGLFMVGLCLVYLCNILDDMGMLTTQMLSGLTVPQFNVWVLLICTIAGSILSAVTIRR